MMGDLLSTLDSNAAPPLGRRARRMYENRFVFGEQLDLLAGMNYVDHIDAYRRSIVFVTLLATDAWIPYLL